MHFLKERTELPHHTLQPFTGPIKGVGDSEKSIRNLAQYIQAETYIFF